MTLAEAVQNMTHPVRKPIVPYSAFVNGKKADIHGINVVSAIDNFFDHVIFKYTLYDENCHWVGEGAYELKGAPYRAWNAVAADVTDREKAAIALAESAFQIVADGIGVEFQPYPCGTFFGTGEAE